MQPSRLWNGSLSTAYLAPVVAGFLCFVPATLATPLLPDINTNNVITVTDLPYNAGQRFNRRHAGHFKRNCAGGQGRKHEQFIWRHGQNPGTGNIFNGPLISKTM